MEELKQAKADREKEKQKAANLQDQLNSISDDYNNVMKDHN